ncbi:hypothetical protein ACOMHN_049637 [Nucella lapillus]
MLMMRARVQGHRWVDHPAAAVMEARVPGQRVDRPAAMVMEAREQGRCWIDHPAAAVMEARVQGRHWVDRPSDAKFHDMFIHIILEPRVCSTQCPDDWISFRQSCYVFVNDIATWIGAQTVCGLLHSKLLEVESAEENSFIVSQMAIRHTSKVWLGCNDFVREGKYVWTSTSEVLVFTHWAPGEPNNQNFGAGDQDCGVLYANGLWDDGDCENVQSQLPFYCEKTLTLVNNPRTQQIIMTDNMALTVVSRGSEVSALADEMSRTLRIVRSPRTLAGHAIYHGARDVPCPVFSCAHDCVRLDVYNAACGIFHARHTTSAKESTLLHQDDDGTVTLIPHELSVSVDS